jgi:hypothetical protein
LAVFGSSRCPRSVGSGAPLIFQNGTADRGEYHQVPAPPPEPFAVQVIIVDWLYREVDGLAEIKMPVLQHIAGHRNREVYEYLELTHDVRDSRAAAIYSA